MLAYVWPILLVIVSNSVYQICAKSSPRDVSPFAALTVTYLVAAAVSVIFYFVMNRGGGLLHECGRVNWAPVTLGVVIVGLEVGMIYAYRVGWPVSTAATVHSAGLAIVMLAVGALLYREAITPNKLIGVALCLAGLVFINR
ncbi:MAG: EamA family transporter [Oscillibacter sp.]|nr:EamA family transporter [Oscillibacter sp.]